jgi:hypothetical protein
MVTKYSVEKPFFTIQSPIASLHIFFLSSLSHFPKQKSMTNWQKTFLLTLLITTPLLLKAQTGVDTLSRLLLALDDTLSIYQNDRLLSQLSLRKVKSQSGEIQLDLDKEKGDWSPVYYLCTRGDTLSVQAFEEQASYFKATNGFDTVLVLLNFYHEVPAFSSSYRTRHRGQVQWEVPPVYELVHIAFSITDPELLADEVFDLQTYYFDEVNNYFMPYRDHPLIQSLNTRIADSSFEAVFNHLTRQSLPLTFRGDRIVHNEMYPMPYRINPWTGHLLQQLQDFADQTGFLDFMDAYKGYYNKLLHEQQQFIELDTLWRWLEEQLPSRIDGYKVLFSPLAGKRSEYQLYASEQYRECILFLDNPERLIQQPGSNTNKKARLGKKVFDEILPFYQQPIIEKHRALIQSIFNKRSAWMANGYDRAPLEVFEAYMSNAIFCLWAEQTFNASEARMIRRQIEKEMLDKGYIRFYAFSRQLISLFQAHEGQKEISGLLQELLQQE